MLTYSILAKHAENKALEKFDSKLLIEWFHSILHNLFNDDPCDPVEYEGKREEMDTLGSLVDKLSIVTVRMWHAQDDLYRFRRMTPEEWAEEFEGDPDRVRHILKRACDLNLQRNQLMDEIDKLNVEQLSMDEEERIKLFQPKHKQY